MRFKLADLLALLALIAAAFFFFAPFVMHDMPRGLGFAGVWGFGSLFCLLVAWHVLPDSAHRHLIGNGPWFVILGGIAITVAGIGWYNWQTASPAPRESEIMRRAESDFSGGFAGGVSRNDEVIQFTPPRSPAPTVREWLRSNLIYMAKILVFYIPDPIDMTGNRATYETCLILADRYKSIIASLEAKGDAGTGPIGNPWERSGKDAVFTGTIYIYYEGNLTEDERSKLREIFKEKGAKVYFRDRHLFLEEKGFRSTIEEGR